MDQLLVETARCFDSVSLDTLKQLIGHPATVDLEGRLIELIVSGRMEKYRIDQGYLVNQNPQPVMGNLLKKLESLETYVNSP